MAVVLVTHLKLSSYNFLESDQADCWQRAKLMPIISSDALGAVPRLVSFPFY